MGFEKVRTMAEMTEACCPSLVYIDVGAVLKSFAEKIAHSDTDIR
jgi:hypothetical protein